MLCDACATQGLRVPKSRVQCVQFQSKLCTPDSEGLEKMGVWQRKGDRRYFFTNSSNKCRSKECSIVIYPSDEEPFQLAEELLQETPDEWCDGDYLILVIHPEAEQLVAGSAANRAANEKRKRRMLTVAEPADSTTRRVSSRANGHEEPVAPTAFMHCDDDDKQRAGETDEQHRTRLNEMSQKVQETIARAAERAAAAQEEAKLAQEEVLAAVARQTQLNAAMAQANGAMRSCGSSSEHAPEFRSLSVVSQAPTGIEKLEQLQGAGYASGFRSLSSAIQVPATVEESGQLQEARQLAAQSSDYLRQGRLKEAEDGFIRTLRMLDPF